MDPATHEPSDPYARDVYRICHAETLSGAMQLDEGARPVQVAQWLGANVMTDEGRQFLVSIAKAGGPEAKRKVLRTEITRVGLSDCPLVNAWSGDG